ncbi:MAG: hypothetical protein HKO68_18730, partial [Desulfobacterales bacterium]|nr:hypothetical protein [Desulfobacterales bacterium]
GYIDVSISNGKEGGLIFILNGRIMGGSFSWDNGQLGPTHKNQELLVHKSKESGATFNVCRMSSSKKKSKDETDTAISKPSADVFILLEELLMIFENTITSKKKMKADFYKLLKKKLVDNAEKYAFLDPFAGEFEYSDHKITFSGSATDQELISGVTSSVRELAQELELLPGLLENSASWLAKHSTKLEKLGIKL